MRVRNGGMRMVVFAGFAVCALAVHNAVFADNWKASANAGQISGAIVPNSANTDLGIGRTNAPSWKAEIRSESATGNGGTYKVLKLSTASTTSNIDLSATTPSSSFFVLSNDVGSGFIFSTGTEGTNGIGTERMRILSSNGNIGINTTTIGSRLQVYGNTAIGYSASTAAPTDGLLVNGAVGIGTTTVGSYKLAVEGKVGAREVVVTQAAWADHVFKDNYNLKPLDKVAEYIKTHKHLEGIPTQAEVKKNGVPIGEMQAKLLQKVEELTLYTIAMKKENDNLRIKVEELEKKVGR